MADELPPPEPTGVEDPTLDPGTEVTYRSAATNGAALGYLRQVVSKSGTVASRRQSEDHAKTCKVR
ncbi:MAG: hypothetical protein ACLU48_04510 [Clostridiaceae bacterium]